MRRLTAKACRHPSNGVQAGSSKRRTSAEERPTASWDRSSWAIAESRLISLDERGVIFRWKDSRIEPLGASKGHIPEILPINRDALKLGYHG